MATKIGAIETGESLGFDVSAIDAATSSQPAPAESAPNAGMEDNFWETSSEDVEMPEKSVKGQEQLSQSEEEPQEQEAMSDEFEVEAFKRQFKFKLDKNDPNLRRTLRQGLKAEKIREKALSLQEELKKERASKKEISDKAAVFSELESAVTSEQYDRAVKALLGPEKYQKYLHSKVNEILDYEAADPARKAEIDRARYNNERAEVEERSRKEIEQLRARLEAHDMEVSRSNLRSMALSQLEKYDFEALVDDKSIAHGLREELWNSALTELEKRYGDSDDVGVITPQAMKEVFAQKAKLMMAGRNKAVSKQVDKVMHQKKEEAKKAAATVATKNYSSGPSKEKELASGKGWKTAKDLLKQLARG